MKCRLKVILWEKNMTQKEFSKRVGISETSISKIVRGGGLELETAMRIANELEMRIDDIWKN